MNYSRILIAAGFAVAISSAAVPSIAAPVSRIAAPIVVAQGYGRVPLMRAHAWSVQEDGGWNSTWTFVGPNTMQGRWHNEQTGERRRANNMMVSRRGQQIIVSRPGLGNYVGTISPDGQSMEGTLSWSSGRFSAHIKD
jgi:hypothetical protein